jgi:hypothetical protein
VLIRRGDGSGRVHGDLRFVQDPSAGGSRQISPPLEALCRNERESDSPAAEPMTARA